MTTETPILRGERVLLRPGTPDDVAALHHIRSEPAVMQWWMTPEPLDRMAAELRGEADEVLFIIEVDGAVAGGIQYLEENEPDYRHASIDIYLGEAYHGRGLGPEAVRVLAQHLIDARGHHRITLDPAVANVRAIRAYEAIGFRRVGVMRRYERDLSGTWRDGLLMDLLAEELNRQPLTDRGTAQL